MPGAERRRARIALIRALRRSGVACQPVTGTLVFTGVGVGAGLGSSCVWVTVSSHSSQSRVTVP